MIWQGWLFIGAVAFVATVAGFAFMAGGDRYDDLLILAALVGLLSWGLFAFQSLNVRAVSSGVEFQFQYAPMTVWAIAMALSNVYMLIHGPISLIDQRGRVEEEVTR